jgi:hypothetical protein
MIILTNRGRSLVNLPVGTDARDQVAPPGCVQYQQDPKKSEAAPLEGAASGTEGNRPKKAFDAPIVSQYRPSYKEFSTMQAQAARAGHELTTSRHDETGLTLWQVSRWGQSRQFSEWSDVCAFVAHIGGLRHV